MLPRIFFCRFSISSLNCSFLTSSSSMSCFASSLVSSRFFASARVTIFELSLAGSSAIVSSNFFLSFCCCVEIGVVDQVESESQVTIPKVINL